MPNWKKVIVSGSDASLSNLIVDGAITASIISGSQFTGSFYGDGSDLTGIIVDDGLPRNDWDYNVEDDSPINDFQTGSTIYIIDFKNQILVGTPVGEIAWTGNITGKTQLIPSEQGVYIVANDVTTGFVGVSGYSGSIVGVGNVMDYSASVDNKWKQTAITGSNTFNGDQIISGNVFISGTTELGGNIVPKTPQGATLGTLERPFSEIFVSSGSINIASDTPGDPNTTLTNIGGNILVSAGGMRLVGDASFIAATGSFQYISGSMTQVGNYTQLGTHILTGNSTISGSLLVSGSTIQIGNNTLTGNTELSGSVGISGSLYMNGNKQFNYGQFCDTTTQSGSANTAYPMKLNTTDISSGVSVVNGTQIKVDNTGIYNLQFSAQFQETVNAAAEISVWLRKGGVNVTNSNTELTIEKVAGGGKLVAAWNYMIQLNATEYVELVWSSDKSTTQLLYQTTQTTPTRPATPSLIVTLTQIA